MEFEYFDIHSHLFFKDYDDDRIDVIKKMKKEKIGTITVGTDLETSKQAFELAKDNENLFACVGQHPAMLTIDSVFDDKLKKLASHKDVVAIGEAGLDYFRMEGDNSELKFIQKTIFEYHIDLALEVEKPIMLHIRSSKGTMDAYEDALAVLEHHSNISGAKLKGNAHFFAGNMEVLKRFLAIGFTVSFTGVVTFTRDYDEFITYTPLDMIMSETDSPFVAPVPHRGKRNSPLHIGEVVKKIAHIRDEDEEVVKRALIDNTLRNFPTIA